VQIESCDWNLEVEFLEGCEHPSVEELRLVESIWPELSELMSEITGETAGKIIA
jgi:hypothetical protein